MEEVLHITILTICYNNKYHVRKSGILVKPRWYSQDDHRYGGIYSDFLEKEYQKTLIPTKTPNPSDEKGFVRLIKKYCPGSKEAGPYTIYKNDYLKLVKNIQANGESPEVDNPVPSLGDLFDEWKSKNTEYLDFDYQLLIDFGQFIINKLQNGRTTDKVEPSIEILEYPNREDSFISENDWVDDTVWTA